MSCIKIYTYFPEVATYEKNELKYVHHVCIL